LSVTPFAARPSDMACLLFLQMVKAELTYMMVCMEGNLSFHVQDRLSKGLPLVFVDSAIASACKCCRCVCRQLLCGRR
jgi:hypothetical protein